MNLNTTVIFLNFESPKSFFVITLQFDNKVMLSKDVDGNASKDADGNSNSFEPDQTVSL